MEGKERFKKPTRDQIKFHCLHIFMSLEDEVSDLDLEKTVNCMATSLHLCIDRLYDKGDITQPSYEEDNYENWENKIDNGDFE